MIDFDNPNTFPKELKNWGTEFETVSYTHLTLPTT